MMRTVALFAASLILTSCGARSSLPVETVAPVAPAAVDPRLCAPLEAEPPVAGTIVAPVTADEADAVRDHLTSDAEARSWGRRGWERAAVAARRCGFAQREAP
ncbi:hypothetical protein O3U67_15635 [Brevundimonas diminuta]|uniref:hypothetical protein n=1 Tax=Brevundimonas diminuta TaxID=293 RepID=UPI0022AF07DC|nr:hypothetical protein [Brevundimonas diminuta]MCZ4109521.1 hypothetical protein [Brevundimonas diminuta]